jgi:methionyl-tRNA synthetase
MESKESKPPLWVTSALPYVNNVPHLGNIIGAVLSGDVYTRFKKLEDKYRVIYLCGTDEFGTATEVKAKQDGVSCQELCDKYHKLHKEIYDWFNIDFTVWGRTTQKDQTELTHEIFLELYKNGYIMHKVLTQFWCDTCKLFLADRYINCICHHADCNGTASGDQCDKCDKLIDVEKLEKYWCSTCKQVPEKKESKHLFLKLQDFTDKLKEYVNKTTMTSNAYKVSNSWFSTGLHEMCITRDLQWGTKFPKTDIPELQDYLDKVFYVWFDAPIGYLSILKHEDPTNFKEFVSGNSEIVQFFGKDNIRFHCITYPATLFGTNLQYKTATQLCSTEYLLYEGKKFSKRNNIGIFGDKVADISKALGINEDYWRYYLIKIRPETGDSSFSKKEFVDLIRGELCYKIGNLINRTLSLINNYFPNTKLVFESNNMDNQSMLDELDNTKNKYIDNMNAFKFRDALTCVLSLTDVGNLILEKYTPWKLIKENKEKTKFVLTKSLYVSYVMIKLFEPIMPKTSQTLQHNIIMKTNHNILIRPTENLDFEVNMKDYKMPFVQIDLEQLEKLDNM